MRLFLFTIFGITGTSIVQNIYDVTVTVQKTSSSIIFYPTHLANPPIDEATNTVRTTQIAEKSCVVIQAWGSVNIDIVFSPAFTTKIQTKGVSILGTGGSPGYLYIYYISSIDNSKELSVLIKNKTN